MKEKKSGDREFRHITKRNKINFSSFPWDPKLSLPRLTQIIINTFLIKHTRTSSLRVQHVKLLSQLKFNLVFSLDIIDLKETKKSSISVNFLCQVKKNHTSQFLIKFLHVSELFTQIFKLSSKYLTNVYLFN